MTCYEGTAGFQREFWIRWLSLQQQWQHSACWRQRLHWLPVSVLEKPAGRGDPHLAAPAFSLSSSSQSFSSFAFSGSNLVVLIIKASASCCCRVNQEVKRAPKNSIFTQVDQHNKEHAGDPGRLLSCQIKWRRGSLLETDNKQLYLNVFCCGLPGEHARWAILWHNVDPLWVNTYQLILWSFILNKHTYT